MNAAWTVAIKRLEIHLRVGVHQDEVEPQPLWVSLRVRGSAPAIPTTLRECIDYEPLCQWLTEQWPCSPHTPLLESRVNELLTFVFGLDSRVQEVHVGLYKQRMSRQAVAVGIERHATRHEFEAHQASLNTQPSVLDRT